MRRFLISTSLPNPLQMSDYIVLLVVMAVLAARWFQLEIEGPQYLPYRRSLNPLKRGIRRISNRELPYHYGRYRAPSLAESLFGSSRGSLGRYPLSRGYKTQVYTY